jgi:hypothetical protein
MYSMNSDGATSMARNDALPVPIADRCTFG